MDAYYDSIRTVDGDSVLLHEGSEFMEYRKFLSFWEPRLFPHGNFSIYVDYLRMYYVNQIPVKMATSGNTDPWNELGPNQKPQYSIPSIGNFGQESGVGPIEFITFYEPDPNYMLCSSTFGGLFYSTNGGDTWQNGGTDTEWPRSGCGYAVFHPTDNLTWYATSGGSETSPGGIFFNGGVFRTNDQGQTWSQIADYTDFNNNIWTTIYKIVIAPDNSDILYVATSSGVFKTTDGNSSNPTWSHLDLVTGSDEHVYDLEMKPDDSQTLYACAGLCTLAVCDWWTSVSYGAKFSSWALMKTTDGGNSWSDMAPPSSPLNVTYPSRFYITIEVTEANPDLLYYLVVNQQDLSTGELWKDVVSTGTWNQLNNSIDIAFGRGHGFGVSQTNGNDILISNDDRYRTYISGIWTNYTSGNSNRFQYHVDIEDVVFHPTNANEVWIADHGGIHKSTDNGQTWENKSVGLGVADVVAIANSYTNPEYLLIATNHDGTIRTNPPYSVNWNPEWSTVSPGDGTRCLLDNKDTKYMYTSSWGSWWRSDNFGAVNTFNGIQSLAKASSPCQDVTEGVLNKLYPAIIYRNGRGTNPTNPDNVYRSFARGASSTNFAISSFETFFPSGNYTCYRILKLFTPYSNGNYLFVHIQSFSSSGDKHHLFRTKIAIDPDAANVMNSWVELPLPRNGWVSDVDFDLENQDILYVTYTTPSNYYDAVFTGDDMIFIVNYTDPSLITYGSCPTGLCTDLTLNLPKTGTSNNAFEMEKGSDGGMYLATDFGVFYTNNKLIADGTSWEEFGTELPNVIPNGIEIVYPSNKIRIGLHGRGVWENNLACPQDLPPFSSAGTLNIPVNPQSGFYEAQYINVNQTINGQVITARATEEIVITSDILAGSNAHFYIHGCDQPGNSFKKKNTGTPGTESELIVAYPAISEKKEDLSDSEINSESNLTLTPNPTGGRVVVYFSPEKITTATARLEITDIIGQRVFVKETFAQGVNNYLDLSHLQKGIYFLKIFTADEVRVEKVVIE